MPRRGLARVAAIPPPSSALFQAGLFSVSNLAYPINHPLNERLAHACCVLGGCTSRRLSLTRLRCLGPTTCPGSFVPPPCFRGSPARMHTVLLPLPSHLSAFFPFFAPCSLSSGCWLAHFRRAPHILLLHVSSSFQIPFIQIYAPHPGHTTCHLVGSLGQPRHACARGSCGGPCQVVCMAGCWCCRSWQPVCHSAGSLA
jgi:hypothetical protein